MYTITQNILQIKSCYECFSIHIDMLSVIIMVKHNFDYKYQGYFVVSIWLFIGQKCGLTYFTVSRKFSVVQVNDNMI